MAKKCIPGVICFENITIVVIILVIVIFSFYFCKYTARVNNESISASNSASNSTNNSGSNSISNMMMMGPPMNNSRGFVFNNSYVVPPRMNDPLLDPYNPPLRDNTYMMPINIPTQRSFMMEDYRQVGLLTRANGNEMILPLMGQQILSNRDKWNYYTMSDKNTIVKLPIYYRGKSCMNEYGIDSINSGEHVQVEGYGDNFKVTLYDNKLMRYIPVF